MRSRRRFAILAAASVGAAVTPLSMAAAAPSGDPNIARTATPAHACAAIPATLSQFGVEAVGFDFKDCVKELAGRVPNTWWGGDPYEQCAMLEEGIETPGGVFEISYPYTFHAEAGDPFPDLTAHDREQCARALWTFHTIESMLPAPPEA